MVKRTQGTNNNGLIQTVLKTKNADPVLNKKHSPATIKIISSIRHAIENKELLPGARLPTERELSSEWNVSRPVVVTALTVLEVLGYIRADQGSGRYVSDKDSVLIGMSPLQHLVTASSGNIYNLAEWRMLTEAYCAELAAVRATSDDLRGLDNILYEMECQAKCPEVTSEGYLLDLKFHECLVNATHNDVVISSYRTLMGLLTGVMELNWALYYKSTQYQRKLLKEHRAIYELVKNRDAGGASAATRKHLERVLRGYRKLSL